jgi:hypothetical protein
VRGRALTEQEQEYVMRMIKAWLVVQDALEVKTPTSELK